LVRALDQSLPSALVCCAFRSVSQEQTFASKLPPQTLLYNEVFCAPGWNVSFSHSGRFLVALPNGAGVRALVFASAADSRDASWAALICILLTLTFTHSGGVPGATFGGASLRPGFSGDVTNHHTFGGTINTNSCGVGLASGCCGSGYVGVFVPCCLVDPRCCVAHCLVRVRVQATSRILIRV
jgi:hypothetical protein